MTDKLGSTNQFLREQGVVDKISAGIAKGMEGGDVRRLRKRAAAYRPNPRAEQILELKRRDPAAFAKLPVEMRMTASLHEQAKAAHEAYQAQEDQ